MLTQEILHAAPAIIEHIAEFARTYLPAIQHGASWAGRQALATLAGAATCRNFPIIATYGMAAIMRFACAMQAREAEKRRDHMTEAGVLAALAAVHVEG